MVQVDELAADRLRGDHHPPCATDALRPKRPEVPAGTRVHVRGTGPIDQVGHGQHQGDTAEHGRDAEHGMQQREGARVGAEPPRDRPLFPAHSQPPGHTWKWDQAVPLGRIPQVGNHILGHEHVNGGADGVQPSKNVQRVMLETGKRPTREEQVDRDALGQCIAGGHFRDASGRARREADGMQPVIVR